MNFIFFRTGSAQNCTPLFLILTYFQTYASSNPQPAGSSFRIRAGYRSRWGRRFLQWQGQGRDRLLDKYAALPEYPVHEVPGKTAGNSLPERCHPERYATGKSAVYPC